MNNIKISFRLLTHIYLTKKTFILYDLIDNKITGYKFTDNLQRYIKTKNKKTGFTNFKLVEIIKQDIKITL